MIQSGKNFDLISEKIAILKHAIKQAGDQGRTNIHDSCENLVKNLLNLTFGYSLINLNEEQKNFPGLDIGEKSKIAYQITSDKTSEKIDETLTKVIRFRHYNIFPSINVFILSGKQGSYTIKTSTTSLFSFTAKDNIFDFDDLLTKIKHSVPETIKAILDFLETELPDTIQVLKQGQSIKKENRFLIDTEAGQKASNLNFFYHWSFHITLHGNTYTAPKIYKAIENLFTNNIAASNWFRIYNKAFYVGANSKEAKFVKKLSPDGALNSFRQTILLMEENSIKVEHANYKSNENFISNLNEEIGSLLTLLFVCYQLNKNSAFQAELSVDLTTNGKLNFTTQSSIYSVEHYLSNYILNPSPLEFSRMVYNITNEEIIELMQEVIYGFAVEQDHFGLNKPYLDINEQEQNVALTHFKHLFFPPDF